MTALIVVLSILGYLAGAAVGGVAVFRVSLTNAANEEVERRERHPILYRYNTKPLIDSADRDEAITAGWFFGVFGWYLYLPYLGVAWLLRKAKQRGLTPAPYVPPAERARLDAVAYREAVAKLTPADRKALGITTNMEAL